jgi:DNA-damage-inducible protein J
MEMKTVDNSRITQMTILLNEELKDRATCVCDSLGITLNAYIIMALRELVYTRRVPFGTAAADDVPNEETYRAMAEAEAKAMGIIADDSPSFSRAQDLFAYLDGE